MMILKKMNKQEDNTVDTNSDYLRLIRRWYLRMCQLFGGVLSTPPMSNRL
jgi:hypothetical protein